MTITTALVKINKSKNLLLKCESIVNTSKIMSLKPESIVKSNIQKAITTTLWITLIIINYSKIEVSFCITKKLNKVDLSKITISIMTNL